MDSPLRPMGRRLAPLSRVTFQSLLLWIRLFGARALYRAERLNMVSILVVMDSPLRLLF